MVSQWRYTDAYIRYRRTCLASQADISHINELVESCEVWGFACCFYACFAYPFSLRLVSGTREMTLTCAYEVEPVTYSSKSPLTDMHTGMCWGHAALPPVLWGYETPDSPSVVC